MSNIKNLFRVLATFTFWAANGFMAVWMFSALYNVDTTQDIWAGVVLFLLMIMLPLWAAVMVITGGFLMLAKKACRQPKTA